MLGLAVICTAVAYFIYFWLLNSVGPTRTTSVTFLVPLFGMIWGRLFLGEELTPGMFAGLAFVFGGIVLVADLKPRPNQPLAPHPLLAATRTSGHATPGGEPATGASPTSASAPAAGATAAGAEQEAATTACGGCE